MWATISVDGLFETHSGVPTLKEMQNFVGGYVECIGIERPFMMWLNEEGKLEGQKLNEVASELAFSHISVSDYIAGNVVITGGADMDGETLPLSYDDISFLFHRVWEIKVPV